MSTLFLRAFELHVRFIQYLVMIVIYGCSDCSYLQSSFVLFPVVKYF